MKLGTKVRIVCQRDGHHEEGCPYKGMIAYVQHIEQDGNVGVDLDGEALEFKADELEEVI